MRVLVDMNLSPEWVTLLNTSGLDAVHWSEVGDPKAADTVLFEWATKNHQIIFTHDLDFGTMLALTKTEGPSVLQIRTQDLTPKAAGPLVIEMLRKFESALESGALLTIDESNQRIRLLPLNT